MLWIGELTLGAAMVPMHKARDGCADLSLLCHPAALATFVMGDAQVLGVVLL